MSQPTQNLKAEITSTLDSLPPESLALLSEFAAFLREKAAQSGSSKHIIRLGGLWASAPEITEADIDEARKEMWGDFGERSL